MAQEVLDSDPNVTWAYIDIKTLFESSTSELVGRISQISAALLSLSAIKKLSIFKNFILEFVKEIRKQILLRIQSSWSAGTRIKSAISGSADELFEKLDEFIQEVEQDTYLNVTGSIHAIKARS